MINIEVSSVNFNYSSGELKDINVVYSGNTDSYEHNINGNLEITNEEFEANSTHPELVKLIKAFLITTLQPIEE